MKKKVIFTTETNQDFLDLTYVNMILLKMYETPFPITPGELLNWDALDLENIAESITLLLYMEEREYIKNIGTIKKPFFELTPLGVSYVEVLQDSPIYNNVIGEKNED